jgi:hypothetical protein
MQQTSTEPLFFERVRTAVTFLAHQLMSTWGVAILASVVVSFCAELISFFGFSPPGDPLFAIRSPFYPSYIVAALTLGFLLGTLYQHRSMLRVWLLPTIGITVLLAVDPVPIPGRSRWSHYFGRACAGNPCADQLLTT